MNAKQKLNYRFLVITYVPDFLNRFLNFENVSLLNLEVQHTLRRGYNIALI